MIKTVLAIFLAVCLSLVSVEVMAQKGQSLLWRISGKGLSKPSYLFGSMDYICPADYFWTKNMQECLAKSDEVCFSLNITDPVVKRAASQAVISGTNKKIKDYFTTKEYEAVKHFAHNEMGLDMDLPKIQSLKPLAIQPAIVKQLLGCSSPVTYELRIIAEAQKEHKKVTGIETAAEFVHDIDATHFNDKVAAILVEMANGSTFYHNYRANMEAAYKRQDIETINKLFKNSSGKMLFKADLKIFLNEKNERWANRMPAMMKKASVFFAVNPTNMAGEEGVINLLRKEGYTVEPIY